VLVGGDFQGANPAVRNAQQTVLGRDAVVWADATESGDGGRVILWADGSTRAHGSLSARGGLEGGNGGFVEVSGRENLLFDGAVDASAPQGAVGTVRFDPLHINIDDGGLGYSGSNDTFGEIPDTAVTFTRASIEAALSSAAVVLQANSDIFVRTSLDSPVGNSLTLQAGRTVSLFGQVSETGAITMNGGDLLVIANSALADGVVDAQRQAGAADILVGNGTDPAAITTGGGNLSFEIRDGAGLTNNTVGDLTVSTSATVETAGGSLDATVAVGGDIHVDSGLSTALAPLGDVALAAGGILWLGAPISTDGGSVTLTGGTVLKADVTIDTEAGFEGPAGAIDLSGAQVSTQGAPRDLTLDASTGGTQAGGNVSLGLFDNAWSDYVNRLQVDTYTGTGTYLVG
jgi:hypothetical protein